MKMYMIFDVAPFSSFKNSNCISICTNCMVNLKRQMSVAQLINLWIINQAALHVKYLDNEIYILDPFFCNDHQREQDEIHICVSEEVWIANNNKMLAQAWQLNVKVPKNYKKKKKEKKLRSKNIFDIGIKVLTTYLITNTEINSSSLSILFSCL